MNELNRIMCAFTDRIYAFLKEMYLRNIQIQEILYKEVERMILALSVGTKYEKCCAHS